MYIHKPLTAYPPSKHATGRKHTQTQVNTSNGIGGLVVAVGGLVGGPLCFVVCGFLSPSSASVATCEGIGRDGALVNGARVRTSAKVRAELATRRG